MRVLESMRKHEKGMRRVWESMRRMFVKCLRKF